MPELGSGGARVASIRGGDSERIGDEEVVPRGRSITWISRRTSTIDPSPLTASEFSYVECRATVAFAVTQSSVCWASRSARRLSGRQGSNFERREMPGFV